MNKNVSAKFIGYQQLGNGEKIRLYNIEGNHPKANSTVSLRTLFNEHIDTGLSVSEIYQELNMIDSFFGR